MNIILDTFMVLLCITLSGFASGLTIGLVTLKDSELNEEDEVHQQIKATLENRHLLLVTLLLMNTIVNESLPIFLEELLPPSASAMTATILVLVFGEIIPSALFIGSNKLKLIAAVIPIVKAFNILFFPLSFPISKILDNMVH